MVAGLTVEVITKDNQNIKNLQTLQGSTGTYIFAFDEESLHFKRGEYLYYSMPIERAIKNLKEVKDDIRNNIITERLDDWSQTAIGNRYNQLTSVIEDLERYQDKELLLYCNEDEYLWIYENEDKTPYSERNKQWEDLRNVAQGLYYGKYLTSEQRNLQELEKRNLMSLLEEQEWIEKVEHFSSVYDVQHIVVGRTILNRFVCKIFSPILKVDNISNQSLNTLNDFRMKLKKLLLPLDISIDENISSKYNLNYYDYNEGALYMEFYSIFNNQKLQNLNLEITTNF